MMPAGGRRSGRAWEDAQNSRGPRPHLRV